VFSGRTLKQTRYHSVAFRFIAANGRPDHDTPDHDTPDHDTIATFRRHFRKDIAAMELYDSAGSASLKRSLSIA